MKIYGIEIQYTPPTYAPDLRTEWLRAEYRDCKTITDGVVLKLHGIS